MPPIIDDFAPGLIRSRSNVRPLESVREIVAGAVRASGLQAAVISSLAPLCTEAGEYAAHARIRGLLGGRPAELHVGVIMGDDSYDLAVGCALEITELDSFSKRFRAHLRADTGSLGERMRRFVYRPPPGFTKLSAGLVTWWVDPCGGGVIEVPPAIRATRTAESVVLAHLERHRRLGREVVAVTGPERVHAALGLDGNAWEIAIHSAGGRHLREVLVILQDGRYLYCLRLESDAGAPRQDVEILGEMSATVQPLPYRRHELAPPLQATVEHWAA